MQRDIDNLVLRSREGTETLFYYRGRNTANFPNPDTRLYNHILLCLTQQFFTSY